MKRIEGVSWRTLIHEDTHDAWAPLLAGHGDHLRAHVEILVQVCRALEFAHEHGVVHRDVKPANVMIGRFGEVYLVDWGVALRLDERADEPRGIVGTPGFLAPEMVRGDPELVSPRTDVYLLGATLYEVLARRPPHDAPTSLAALVGAFTGEPPPAFPEDAPRELVALARRAMSLSPDDRPPGAEAFREALSRFLTLREMDRVLAEGRAALARAREIFAAEGASAPDAFRALVEARFAFAATHRVRADEESHRELQACLSLLVEREIALRSPAGARAVLAEMSARPPALVARVEALEEVVRAERAAADERERARIEGDSSRSLPAMVGVVSVIISLMVLTWGGIASGGGGREIEPGHALGMWLVAFVAFGAVGFVARRQILTNRTTRALAGFLAIALLAPFVSTAVAVHLDAPMYQRSIYSWISSAGVAALGELMILPQIWPCAAVYLAGTIALLAMPSWAFGVQPVVIVANAVLLVRALRLHAARSRVEPPAA